jgi:adenylate cyclase
LRVELDGLEAAIGLSAGRVVAGNIGAAERYEYTVIGDPVNEAARLTELAKTRPSRLLASEEIVRRASEREARRWEVGELVVLRGRSGPTLVAAPA